MGSTKVAEAHVDARARCRATTSTHVRRGIRAPSRTMRRRRLRVAPASASGSYRVGLLPGDGIGPEITRVAVAVLEGVAAASSGRLSIEFEEGLVGGAAIDATGEPLPAATLEMCRGKDAVLLAAIGGYKWDDLPSASRPERGLLALRAGLKCFANLRPAVVLPQLADASTLKPEVVSGVDLMVVRELTGGIYFGEPRGFGTDAAGSRTGFNTMVYSEPEVDRIARVACEMAMKRNKKLTSVDKSNVLEVSQLWRERVTHIVETEYPEVSLAHMYVDNASMQLIRDPKSLDTIVTGNIFGDILSDQASMLTGSIGMLPSASIGDGSGPGIFEPVHGSAPDIAGLDAANPLAMVLSAAMMLRYGLAEPEAAGTIEQAVQAVLDGGFRTGDIMSEGMTQVTCSEMCERLMEQIQKPATV